MKKGYIQVYTGDGKGKTTAALGLAIRAAGAGHKVKIAQFMKAMFTSEMNVIDNIENIELFRASTIKKFIWHMTKIEMESLKKDTQKLLYEVMKWNQQHKADVIILDEILGALSCELVTKDQIEKLLDSKSDQIELVLTGRNAPDWLIEKADLVSEIKPIKHYMDSGVNARKGIEF